MAYTNHEWVDGELITAEKLNNGVYQEDVYLEEINYINSKLFGGTKNYNSGLSYITEVEPFRNATLQQVWYDNINHEWYISQSDSQTTEGFVISRMASNGRYLDSMHFVGAGHGTQEIFKNVPNSKDVYIHIRYYDGTADIYTTKYVGNTTVNSKTELTKNAPLLSGKTGQFAMFDDKIAQLADDGNLYFWNTIYNKDTGIFNNDNANLITYNYSSDLPTDAVAQGTALISKESITGNYLDKGKYVVVRLEGASDIRINFYFWEVDTGSSTISYKGSIENLENSVIANQTEDGNWSGTFEPEGIATIEYERNGEVIGGGLVISLNSGEFGYRSQYIYGILNTSTLSELLSQTKANTKILGTGYDLLTGTQTFLYNLNQHEQYFFNYQSAKTYTDLPNFLKNSTQSFDALLINSKKNMQGTFVQTLKILYPKEVTLERYVRRDVKSYGKQPVYDVTPWRITSDSVSTGRDAKFIPSSGKLTDFAPIGMAVYLTRDQINSAPDVGNLNSLLTVTTGGGVLKTDFMTPTMVVQTFVHNASGTTIAKRRYSITPSIYGVGGEVSGSVQDWTL